MTKGFQIKAPHFTAGGSLMSDHVVEAAPIIGYMAAKVWSQTKVEEYCRQKGWMFEIVLDKE